MSKEESNSYNDVLGYAAVIVKCPLNYSAMQTVSLDISVNNVR